MPKFITNIKFKLKVSRWFKYMNFDNVNNNKMGWIKTPSHTAP